MSSPQDAQELNPQTQEQQEPSPQEKRATLLAHLQALRRVLVISAAAILVSVILVFYLLIDKLMAWIIEPITARGIGVIYIGMSEALMTKVKVALIAAVIAASPVVIWQIWSFIKPALYPKEKRAFRVLFFTALLLFLAGVTFCYFAVYTLAVDFFLVQGEDLASPMLSLEKYVSFLFGFIVPFGVAFQLPVAIYVTTRVGITDAKMLASKRKFVILGIFMLAAVLTPPDIVSQIALGVPMCLLYEVSILVAKMTKPRQRE